MPSNYEEITKDNIRRRGDEFDDIGEFIAEQLYSDRVHFLYELFQNCDDAIQRRARCGARSDFPRSITFRLFRDRLEVRHFGKQFDDPDVRGISDVLKGTKRNDPTQIGRFGIGFKSVYAVTSSPEVHSGDEHFRIERYIRPRAAKACPLADGETLFVLPFNHKSVSADEASDEIGARFQSLDLRTLLFVRELDEITWAVEDGVSGRYRRRCEHEGQARCVVLTSGGAGEAEETWLVFERPVQSTAGSCDLRVEVAYRVTTDTITGVRSIDPTARYPLAVFFPTMITTGLGFSIQGPYVPTPARDNIHRSGTDGEWNRGLIAQTATLVAETLPFLRDMGLLSVRALEAMPIRSEDFPEDGMFRPIFDRVREALREQPLLPAHGGGFVAAKHARLARGTDLRELLSDEQLRQLFKADSELKWLSDEITEAKTSDLRSYLLDELNVEEVTPETFARRFHLEFIEQQTDQWVAKFYGFLEGQKALWRAPRWLGDSSGPLRDKPFIRLHNRSHVAPFRSDGFPNAHLPPDGETDYPVVKREVVENEAAHQLLRSLDLKRPSNVTEVIDKVLPKYPADPQNGKTPSAEEHARDIEKIIRALKTASQDEKNALEKRLKETPFLRATNVATGEHAFMRPDDVYIRSLELNLYFEGNLRVHFLADEYAQEQAEVFCQLGVSRTVRLRCKSANSSGHVVIADYRGSHRRGLHRFDPDCEIDGLDHALANPSVERATYGWNELLAPNRHLVRGTVESSNRQTFENPTYTETFSKIGQLARQSAWLPCTTGTFHRPEDLSLKDLPKDFARDDGLASALGMKREALEALALEAGMALVPHDEYEAFQNWKAQISKPDFPVKKSTNPGLRSKRVGEEAANTNEKATEQKLRSVRTSDDVQQDAKTHLRQLYTNNDGQMVCQVCGEEMPFKLDDESYYFEAVECVKDEDREIRENHLALCPICAAKYRYANGSSPEQIRQGILSTKDLTVGITLACRSETVHFVEVHLEDLRVALAELEARAGQC